MRSKLITFQASLFVSTLLLFSCGGKGSSSGESVSITPTATAPTISASGQPQNQTVTAGQTATFSVTATGMAPLTYQWKMGGTNLDGAISVSYTTPITTTADSGSSFTVTVSNASGSVTSSAAILSVNPVAGALDTTPPSVPTGLIAVQIISTQVDLVWTPSTDAVGVTGYRIYRNGALIGTSTTTTHSDTSSTMSNGDSYAVAAYDAAGNISAPCSAVTVTTGHVCYVSPSSVSTDWATAISADTPCTVATAFTNAVAGDIVLFRGGTYMVPQKNSGDWMHGYYNIEHSGTADQPIIFKAYPGETPLFDGASGGTGDIDGHNYSGYCTIFSTHFHSYIVFDGFIFQSDTGVSEARIVVTGGDNYSTTRTTGCVVRNCTLNGGTTVTPAHEDGGSGDNHEGIFISQTEHLTISNCRIFGYDHAAYNHNTSGIKSYHSRYVSVENCEISGCTVAVFYKSNTDDSSIKNNYIHDCGTGVDAGGYGWWNDSNNHSKGYFLNESDNMTICNNVISCMTKGAVSFINADGSNSDNLAIFNNTIYSGNQKSSSVALSSGTGHSFYNNIVYGLRTDGDIGLLRWASSSNDADRIAAGVVVTLGITACDHNQFGNIDSNFLIRVKDPDASTVSYPTLAAWQASTELADGSHPGTGSLVSDPCFADASGSMSTLADFALASGSPCKGAGRNGVDMGADMSLVGILSEH